MMREEQREYWRAKAIRGWLLMDPMTKARLEYVVYLREKEGLTLQKAGERLGVSRERTRQMQCKANRLRSYGVPL